MLKGCARTELCGTKVATSGLRAGVRLAWGNGKRWKRKRWPRGKGSTILATSMTPAASASSRTSRIARATRFSSHGLKILAQPRASRRGQRRPAGGRRRRHPDPAPRPAVPRRGASGWASPCREPGAYGVGMVFLPRNAETRRACEEIDRAFHRRRGPDPARLARRAGRPLGAGREHPADRAGDPPVLRRPRRQLRRCRRVRAQALRHPQAVAQGDPRPRPARRQPPSTSPACRPAPSSTRAW